MKRAFRFENSREGFAQLLSWIGRVCTGAEKTHVIIGAEPTGHYWFTLAAYLKSSDINLVLANPHHVKKSKELDNNHPSKSDRKDPKVIARLVLEGRCSEPYIPEGAYAELRVTMTMRCRILREFTEAKNQMQRWLKIYFPEHRSIFGDYTCVSSMAVLREAPLPADLIALGADGFNVIWRRMKLLAAAKISVGCTDGSSAARMEIKMLLTGNEAKSRQYEEIMTVLEGLYEQLPEVAELLKIKGM